MHVFRKVFACLHMRIRKKSKLRWFIHSKTALQIYCCDAVVQKKVSIKFQAFLVEGVQFLRKMSGAYLFWFFQRVENCEEGVSLVGAGLAGVMGGHKGFIVGLAICHGRTVTGVSKGLPMKRHCWAEGDFGSPWAAQLPSPGQTTRQQHWGRLTQRPKSQAEAEKHTGRKIRFITIQCFSLLKIKWHVWENKRMLMGGAEPMHSQFSLQGWSDTGLSTAISHCSGEEELHHEGHSQFLWVSGKICVLKPWSPMEQGASHISDPSVPCYLQHNMDRDKAGIHQYSGSWSSFPGCLWGPQPLGFTCGRGWTRFCVCKNNGSFSSLPVQLAFWLLVRKYLVVVYFGKTHFIPGMEN